MEMTKTHIVSKVLIRQFCSNGKTKVYNIRNKMWELPKSPIEIASIPIPREIIKKSEKKWNNFVEKKLNNAISDLKKELLFKKNSNIEIIKCLISLHFTRSFGFVYLFKKNEKELYEDFLRDMTKQSDLSEEKLREYWIGHMTKFFPKLLDSQLNKVHNFVFKQNLTIGVSPKRNKFILGDNPVVNISNDNRIGLKEGVGIMQSVNIFLPLSPRHVVALYDKRYEFPHYVKFTAKSVRSINKKTKRNCMREFYAN